jgi:hypothetical protein
MNEYNTQRERLIIPEYGRNIQKLVNHAKTIDDRNERTEFAKAIIKIMANINQFYRDRNDFNQKLWDHLAIISNFELDVDTPFETIDKEVLNEKPRPIEYAKNNITYKHYGRTIELLIQKATDMDDGEEKTALIELIANHMKRLHLAWNKEQNVNDEQIFKNIEELSGGKLQINRDLSLVDSRDIQNKGRKRKYRKK